MIKGLNSFRQTKDGSLSLMEISLMITSAGQKNIKDGRIWVTLCDDTIYDLADAIKKENDKRRFIDELMQIEKLRHLLFQWHDYGLCKDTRDPVDNIKNIDRLMEQTKEVI